jgi:hypothetical protein
MSRLLPDGGQRYACARLIVEIDADRAWNGRGIEHNDLCLISAAIDDLRQYPTEIPRKSREQLRDEPGQVCVRPSVDCVILFEPSNPANSRANTDSAASWLTIATPVLRLSGAEDTSTYIHAESVGGLSCTPAVVTNCSPD